MAYNVLFRKFDLFDALNIFQNLGGFYKSRLSVIRKVDLSNVSRYHHFAVKAEAC